ncbi:hypothetical protein GCM10028868_36720 [Virgibacillus kimchii]
MFIPPYSTNLAICIKINSFFSILSILTDEDGNVYASERTAITAYDEDVKHELDYVTSSHEGLEFKAVAGKNAFGEEITTDEEGSS